MKLQILTRSILPAMLALPLASAAAMPEAFLNVHFRGGANASAEQVHFALSPNGSQWLELNKSRPVLRWTNSARGARDPWLVRHPDTGETYLLASDLSYYSNPDDTKNRESGSKGLVVWRSSDLVDWGRPERIDLAPPDAGCLWSPEAIWDAEQKEFFVFWTSNTGAGTDRRLRIWSSRTRDFKTFSTATLYVERAGGVTDCTIVANEGKFYRFLKDEQDGRLMMETAAALEGEWRGVPGFDGERFKDAVAPECFQLNDGTGRWCLTLNRPQGRGGDLFVTSELAGGSFVPFETPRSMPHEMLNGGILGISLAESQRLLARWGDKDQTAKWGFDRLYFGTYPRVEASLAIDARQSKAISPLLMGIFYEDISDAADGGLYAELIENRDFEYSPADRPEWKPESFWVLEGGGTTLAIETEAPIHQNNPHYAVLETEAPGASLWNYGRRDGIALKRGDRYDLTFFGKTFSAANQDVRFELYDTATKTTVAGTTVSVSGADWRRFAAVLEPSADVRHGRIVVRPLHRGRVALDMISLFPQKTFKGRKNGLRPDLAQAIADLKPTFVRFPGGCIVHGSSLKEAYYWKDSIGPLEARVPLRNLWNYHQTRGLGYYEYFQLCEDIGAEPVPIVASGVPCGYFSKGSKDAVPMEDMAAYTQDILDLIEWANGPADSEWGRKRTEAGHPAPFNLKYLGVGNEEGFHDRFITRFDYIRAVLKEKHPEIVVIGTAGAGPDGHTFDEQWKHAKKTGVPIIDEHFYKDVEWFLNNLGRYDGYERNTTMVYIGEYACNTGSFQGNTFDTALCEAAFLTGLERNGDVVAMASYAPLLACDVTDQWVWRPDLIFFNNSEVKPSVNYHVQKLYGEHSGTEYWATAVAAANQDDFVAKRIAASTVRDPKTGDIIIKLVNILPVPASFDAAIANAPEIADVATMQLLTASSLSDRNAKLTESTIPAGSRFPVELPPYSFAVLRLKTR